MNAIEVDGLTRRYGDLVAVDDVSFSVAEGEILGLLGPNGAGKSTLVNTLCTLLRPSEGTARVAGHDVVADPGGVRSSIGVVFQEPALDEELTGRENLRFHARLYGIRKQRRRERTATVLDLVDLADDADKPVGEYSGGMARRLELARGLLHEPAVLFLDEPTVGLDAGTRKTVREYVARLNREAGVTVVLTTHYMEEADALCDRVAIVDDGSVVALDAPDALKDGLGGDVIRLGTDGPAAVERAVGDAPWVRSVTRTGDGLDVGVDDGERRVAALVTAASEVAGVSTVSVDRPTLERVFLSLTGRTVEAADETGPGVAVAAETEADDD
ncbi:ATP-binding cassette domain-containing protein [Haloarcula pellucida]|uniref:ABC transporter ATP-binding protein n=1 Tax=Haloarcula pellucida TaxID=1427151 RepID=A0A830GFQ9_9EURY|nr:ATP-binding cassette domain-containing protein [Halomicroarcula pellucida]MBX0346936.1 ATP-binding cassette domain-containing protein [Halomicroarcula pellucida]GGN86154.1 ABC transporter ATP-binding protein [Halomicroarcula pellucida]